MKRASQHVFDLPADLFAKVLEVPGVAGALGALRPETGFYAHWPQEEHWAPHVARLAAHTRHLLHIDDRRAIEAKLGAAEKAFDEHLSAPDAGAARRGAGALLDSMTEVEALVCRPHAHVHATHPYFARWASLHAAVLYVFFTGGDHGDIDVPERFVHLWRTARVYLQDARHAAYVERVSKVRPALTGALLDKVFIHDDRAGALTVEVPTGGPEEEELRRVLALIQNEAAARYLSALAIGESVDMIDRGPLGVVVSPKSPAKREHFIEAASVYWRAPQEALREEIEAEQAAWGEALTRLGTENLRRLRAPEAAPRAVGSGTDVVFDILEVMNSVLVGSIPVVGSALSSITGLFLKWARPGAGDPWTAFENSMRRYVNQVVEQIEGTNIKSRLNGFDETFNTLLKDWESHAGKPMAANVLTDFQSRAGRLLDDSNELRWFFFNSMRYHGTVPYFEHYFLLNVAVNVTSQTIGGPSRNHAEDRRKLYESTRTYLEQAIRGLAAERASDLDRKSDGCDSTHYNYDYRTTKAVSSKYEFDHREEKCNYGEYAKMLLKMSQAAAGLTCAAQLMRLAVKNVVRVIEADTEAGYSASLIADTYRREMSSLFKKVQGEWRARGWTYTGKHYKSSSGSGMTVQYKDVTHTWNELWGKLHGDHEVILNLGEAYFTQYHVRPPATVFDISGGRVEEGSNVALSKQATQSSTHSHDYQPTADKAIDGNTSGDFNNRSVTHTGWDAQAWWQVDLGVLHEIYEIDVWNRTDAVAERLSNFDVKLSTDGNWGSSSVLSFNTPGQAPTLLPVQVKPLRKTPMAPAPVAPKARYVREQLRGTDALSLAEVQVWGKRL